MPFTFSHPAIVLPFLRTRKKLFSATGLIVGSIAPDFESFIRVSEVKVYSHTWEGMFWFDLPLAFLIAVVFHSVVRDPLIENLPLHLQQRFDQYRNAKWFTYLKNNVIVVICSLLTGITSHLLWDAFTHLNINNPDSIKSVIMIGHTRLYIILQYACSLVGMVAIILYIYSLPRTKVTTTSPVKFKFWLFTLLLSLLTAALLATSIYENPDARTYVNGYFIRFIYICISSFIISLLVVSLIYKLWFRRNLKVLKG